MATFTSYTEKSELQTNSAGVEGAEQDILCSLPSATATATKS